MHFVNPHICSLSTLQNPIYGKAQGIRKMVIPLPHLPQLPTSPPPHLRVPASGASGASLDNDTFTLTCHQCPFPIPKNQ
ncbi:MAG: hypothetical protein F6K31_18255 [Symploca sp. SIO2G7]|nr:hypothetical protein [Symploca sp. SIO2G7]